MIVRMDGREYTYDQEKFTLQQGIAMFLAYGFTLDGYLDALKATDPRALQCAYWLMLQQNDVVQPLKEADCDLMEFVTALSEAQEAEAGDESEAEPEADPTTPQPDGGHRSPARPSPTATTPPPAGREAVPVTVS